MKQMLNNLDRAGISPEAMMAVLFKYKRERQHLIKIYTKGLLNFKEYTAKVDHLDLCIATVRVLLNRGEKNAARTTK